MENRLLARLSAARVLSLTVATMLVLSFLTVSAQNSSSLTTEERKEVDAKARQVFRNDIVHGKKKDADDEELKTWINSFSGFRNGKDDPAIKMDEWTGTFLGGRDGLEVAGIIRMGARLGNGFGARGVIPAGIVYVMPEVPERGLWEVYVAAEPDSDFETINDVLKAHSKVLIGDWTYIPRYERELRNRMDSDASGKVSEDEFADYVTTYFRYKPKVNR